MKWLSNWLSKIDMSILISVLIITALVAMLLGVFLEVRTNRIVWQARCEAHGATAVAIKSKLLCMKPDGTLFIPQTVTPPAAVELP